MCSKALLSFCISMAVVLTITSQVAARELAETSTSVNNSKTLVNPDNIGDTEGGPPGGEPGGGWYPGGGYGGIVGGDYGGYPSQAVDAEP